MNRTLFTTGGRQRERGAVLLVSLIMLTLIALAVASAYFLSSSNLQSVGNMQHRNEAIAAADEKIELVVNNLLKTSGGALLPPAGLDEGVDVDGDGTNDYQVVIATPTCLEVAQVAAGTGAGQGTSEALNPSAGGYSVSGAHNTLWNIEATATNLATGTQVVITHGVRVQVSDAAKTLYCS